MMIINKSKLSISISVGLFLMSTDINAADGSNFIYSPEQIVQAKDNSYKLILASGIFDPVFNSLNFSKTNIQDLASRRYGIVQFWPHKSNHKWLNKKGFKVIQSLANNAYLVNWLDQDNSKLATNKNIRWYGAFQSGYKISPHLWSNNRQNKPSYQISIRTFKDAKNFNLSGFIKKYLTGVKIIQTNIPKNYGEYVIEMNAVQLNDNLNILAANEDIQWMDFYYQQKFFNTEAVSATQASSNSGGSIGDDDYIPSVTPIWDQGLYGSGQIIGIADSGLDRNEDWFMHLNKGSGVVTAITDAENVILPTVGTVYPNNKIYAYWIMPGAAAYDHASAGFHGTHTTGSIAGDRMISIGTGPNGTVSSPSARGYDNDDGMAPNAQILFDDLGSNGGLTGTGSIPMWQQAFAAGAAIHSNSYGSSTFGAYVSADQRADRVLRELEDMIIVFAAGNDDGQVNTTSSPGNAKNVVTVGALLHGNSSAVASFSNKGPTDDGRLKPDISATGSNIESAAGDSNNSTVDVSPSRRSNSGTSMSTPITAGSIALLRQYFTDGFYPTGTKNSADSLTPNGPLMKAVLLNGSNIDGGFFANNIGWGRVWLDNSLYFDGESKRLRIWQISNAEGLQTGDQFTTSVAVQAGQEFRATLVWYDLEGPTGSGVTLVNNLDLTVKVGANSYFGNNFSSNNSIPTGSADAVNTVEQVRFSTPITGSYQILVDASNIPGNGQFNSDKQGFALVVSGDLSTGNSIPLNPSDPTGLTANNNGLSGIDLTWSDVSVDYDSYEIYRTNVSCANADLTTLRYIGQSNTNSFTDASTTGGFQYSYKVRAFSDDLISGYSNCIDATSQQICSLPPSFNQSSVTVVSNTAPMCSINLNWQAATSNCPAASDVQYNVYRSRTHGFTPNNTNLIATTSINTNSFSDTTVVSGQSYFYVVKSEDTTTTGTGSNNGNESIEVYEVASTALSTTTLEGNIVDDVDNLTLMQLSSIWSISADQASNGLLSYRSAFEGSATYPANTCARMYSTIFSIPSSPIIPANISYQSRYNIEANWDGVVVEISNDGGNNWSDLPPDGGYPNDFSSTGAPPINACGYASTQGAFNGNTSGNFQNIAHNLTAYQGQTVQIRWSLSTDPGSEEEGFYLDELNYNNILVPQACMDIFTIFADGFEN